MKDSFEQELGRELRQSEARLDAQTRAELARIRRKALSPDHGKFWFARRTWSTAGVAMASVAVMVFALLHQPNGAGPGTPEQLSNNIDLYEDLDFYYWLAEPDSGMNG